MRAPDSKFKRPTATPEQPNEVENKVSGCINIEDEDGAIGKLQYTLTEGRELRIVYTGYEGVPPLRNFTAWERRDG